MEPEAAPSTHFRPRPRLAPARKESACDRLRSRHRRSARGYIITLHPISRTMSAWRAAQQPALFDVLCQSSASGSHCIGSRRRRPCALGDLATLKFAAVHNSQIPKAIKAIARGNERRGRFRFQHGGSGCCLELPHLINQAVYSRDFRTVASLKLRTLATGILFRNVI